MFRKKSHAITTLFKMRIKSITWPGNDIWKYNTHTENINEQHTQISQIHEISLQKNILVAILPLYFILTFHPFPVCNVWQENHEIYFAIRRLWDSHLESKTHWLYVNIMQICNVYSSK